MATTDKENPWAGEMKEVLKHLPILVYAILKCRTYGLNWYEALGVDLIQAVRDTKEQLNAVFKETRDRLQEEGVDESTVLKLHEQLEPLVRSLLAPEASVRKVAEEIRESRRSGMEALQQEVETLRVDMRKAKSLLLTTRQAQKTQVASVKEELTKQILELEHRNRQMESVVDEVTKERDLQRVQLTKSNLELTAAREEIAALQERNEKLQRELHSGGRPVGPPVPFSPAVVPDKGGEPGGRGRGIAQNDTWLSRPDTKDERSVAMAAAEAEFGARNQQMAKLVDLSMKVRQLGLASADELLKYGQVCMLAGRAYLVGGSQAAPSDHDGATFLTATSVHMPEALMVVCFDTQTGDCEILHTKGPAPAPRTGHMVSLGRTEHEGYALNVMGGHSAAGPDGGVTLLNDLYQLDLQSNTWSRVSTCLPFGGSLACGDVMKGGGQAGGHVVVGTGWDSHIALWGIKSKRKDQLRPQVKARSLNTVSANGRGASGKMRPGHDLQDPMTGPSMANISINFAGKLYSDRNLPSLPAISPFRWKGARMDRQDDPASRYFGRPELERLMVEWQSAHRPHTTGISGDTLVKPLVGLTRDPDSFSDGHGLTQREGDTTMGWSPVTVLETGPALEPDDPYNFMNSSGWGYATSDRSIGDIR